MYIPAMITVKFSNNYYLLSTYTVKLLIIHTYIRSYTIYIHKMIEGINETYEYNTIQYVTY